MRKYEKINNWLNDQTYRWISSCQFVYYIFRRVVWWLCWRGLSWINPRGIALLRWNSLWIEILSFTFRLFLSKHISFWKNTWCYQVIRWYRWADDFVWCLLWYWSYRTLSCPGCTQSCRCWDNTLGCTQCKTERDSQLRETKRSGHIISCRKSWRNFT